MIEQETLAGAVHAHLRKTGDQLRLSGRIASVEIDGVALDYWTMGAGSQALVFLHGNSCAKEVFYRQFEYFSNADLTLIAIDLPGHGCSGDAVHPEVQYTIPGYAKIVSHALEALDVRDYILVGWSLGGNIALEMAGNGDPISAMLLMGAPPVGPGPDNFAKAYLPSIIETAGANDEAPEDEVIAFAKSIYTLLEPIPKHFLDTALRTDGRAREIMMSHWLSGKNGHDQIKTAENWSKPICVAHGEEEPFVSLSYLQGVTWRHLWEGRVQLLPQGAHAPFVESPDKFNTLLERFITNVRKS